MAAELNGTITFTETKNGIAFTKTFDLVVDVSGNYPVSEIKSIATVDTLLDLGGVATPGYLIAKNKDATNYIILGGDGTNYFDKLKPGEAMAKRWNGAAIHAKANSSACDLEYLLIPD
jgi:hypothetical protein